MITIYFGLPRSGKSTLICREIYKAQKKYNKVLKKAKKKKTKEKRLEYYRKHNDYDNFYTNMDNKLCENRSVKGLGSEWVYPIHSLVCIDEAGIEYNSRKTLSLPQSTIEYLKLHGHYKTDLRYFSQTWEDLDVTIRRLAERYYYIRRLGPFTLVRRIKRLIMINEEKQIIDGFEFYGFLWKLLPWPFGIRDAWKFILRKPYYKYFDSYSKMEGVQELPYQTREQNDHKKNSGSR